jgi:DNA recombination protein RmuC
MSTLEIIFLFLFIATIILAYILFTNKKKWWESEQVKLQDLNTQSQKELAVHQEKTKSLENQIAAKEIAQKEQIQLFLQRSDLEKENLKTDFQIEKTKLLEELIQERSKISDLERRLENAIVTFKNQEEKLVNQTKDIEQLQQKFKTEFENIANKLLDEKSLKFTEQNKTNIDIILNPLKERIKDFEDKVDKTYKAESNERASLKTQIENLTTLNQKLNEGAINLTKALTGDNKAQGNWGEVILEKVLEFSGLTKDKEYVVQATHSNQDGDKIRPDVIINLPDSKHLIIDSKVSLVAYNNLIAAETEEEKVIHKNLHIVSIKSHIKLLSEKKYETAELLNSPDFVLLFLPIESSFALAIQADDDLFNYAWERKIVLVSPSTLLATLRTIAATWKQEKQTKNALEIAKEAGNMLDKFVNFVNDIEDIGKQIDKSKLSYEEAHNKLVSGKGNLINRAKKIQELGAKSDKIKQLDLTGDEDSQ